jgi:hypothetical protein
VGLGDRVVAAKDDRDGAGADDLPHEFLDRRMRARRVGGHDRGIPEVDDTQLDESIDVRLQMDARAPAGRADRPWPEARARTVGDEIIEWGAHDGHVDADKLGRILRIGHSTPGEKTSVVRLSLRAPPRARIEHRAIVTGKGRAHLNDHRRGNLLTTLAVCARGPP